MNYHRLWCMLAVGVGSAIAWSSTACAQEEVRTSLTGPIQMAQATASTSVSASEGEAIHKVVSDYYSAFGRDSAAAAEFYGEPTLIVLPNQAIMLSKRTDVEAF